MRKKSPAVKKIKNDLIYNLALGVISVARIIPLRSGLKIGASLGRLAFRILRPDRIKSLRHLKIAFPDSSGSWRARVGAEAFANLGRSFFEVLNFEQILRESGPYSDYVRMDGIENLQRAKDAGKGGIVVTGHIGNFELMAAYASYRGYEVHPIVRTLYDPRLDKILNDHRRRHNYPPIPRGEEAGLNDIMEVLQQNKFLGILMDQDTKVRGAFVPFLGPLAHTPTGPAFLAYLMGMDVMMSHNHRTPDGRHVVTVSEPIPRPQTGDHRADIHEYTRMMNDHLSAQIRRQPEEWVWMHRRWKKRPPDEPPHLNPDAKPIPASVLKKAFMAATGGILRNVPRNVGEALGGWGGLVARYLYPKARSIAHKNLVNALGRSVSENVLRKIEVDSWSHAGRVSAGALRCMAKRSGAPDDENEFEGLELLDRSLDSGKGAVLLTAPFGSYDAGICALSRKGYPLIMVDRILGDRFWEDRVRRLRSACGLPTWPPTTGAKIFLDAISRKESPVFCLAPKKADDSIGVLMFGRDLSIDATAFETARQASANLLICFSRRLPDGRNLTTLKIPASLREGSNLDPKTIAQECAAEFESGARAYPDQWLWFKGLFE
jgi:Kdo2-lipid IVA lauroyltransferase/acyltransferase